MARMPVITGHEISGIIVKIGADVTGFEVGEKVTADNLEYCGLCYFCHQGKKLLCENFSAYGVHRKCFQMPLTHGFLSIYLTIMRLMAFPRSCHNRLPSSLKETQA